MISRLLVPMGFSISKTKTGQANPRIFSYFVVVHSIGSWDGNDCGR